jgi:O-antigen/teichoic acid export membrane protein
MNEVRKRLLLGSGANGLNLIAKLSEQLLLVPILLGAWSTQLYGEWLLISAIPVYLSLSDLGFLTASSNELARRSVSESENKVKQFFADYVAVFMAWSLVICILVAAISAFLPFDQLFGLEIMSRREAAITFTLLVATTLVSQNSIALLGGLRARKLFPVGLLLRAITALLRLVGIYVLVKVFHTGPISAAVVILVMRAAEYGIQAAILVAKDLPPRWNIFRKPAEPIWPYLGIGMEFMLMPLAQALVLQGMVLMVGTALGAVAVAVFSTHRTLTRFTSQVLQLAVVPLQAEAGLLNGEKDNQAMARLLSSISSMTFWVSVFTGGTLFILGSDIFQAWTDGKVQFVPSLFLVLICSTILEGIWRVASTLRLGSNRHRPLAWGYLILSILGVSAAYLIGSNYGLSEIAIPLVLIDLFMCILAIKVTVPLLDMTYGHYLIGMLTPPYHEVAAILRQLRKKVVK